MTIHTLYHGSSYLHQELHPGFYHVGKVIEWDNVESNKFLYASSEKQDAFEQAFASWLERRFDIAHFGSKNGKIIVSLKDGKVPSQDELKELKVYVYTLSVHEEDGWVKNNNPHNNITTEWKTEKTIPGKHITHVQKYDTHLLQGRVKFIEGSSMALEELYERELIFKTTNSTNTPSFMSW